MSGKWLMCVSSDSSKLYRLDTTNVANLERVADYTYNNSNEFSYVVDDDMVINGWYFEDGKPVQKIESIGYQSYCAWGVSQMARYKTYMVTVIGLQGGARASLLQTAVLKRRCGSLVEKQILSVAIRSMVRPVIRIIAMWTILQRLRQQD